MSTPIFWLIAGPNGAGKTTFASTEPLSLLLGDVVHLNADDETLARLQELGYESFADAPEDVLRTTFVECANHVTDELTSLLNEGLAVTVETVLSTDKFKPFVESVVQAEGFFGLIYVALNSPALACERVARRVKRGGHDVPPHKTVARWHRSLSNLPWFAYRANRFLAFDNSDSTLAQNVRLLATGVDGVVTVVDRTAIPELTAVFDETPQAQ